MGAEVDNRRYLKDFIATLQSWQAWCGGTDGPLSETDARARIKNTTLASSDELPAMTISFVSSQRTNPYGDGQSSNFRASGVFLLVFYAVADQTNTYEDDEDRFGGLVGDILDEMCERSEESECVWSYIRTTENPFQADEVTAEHVTENAENEDEVAVPVWSGAATMDWGHSAGR